MGHVSDFNKKLDEIERYLEQKAGKTNHELMLKFKDKFLRERHLKEKSCRVGCEWIFRTLSKKAQLKMRKISKLM